MEGLRCHGCVCYLFLRLAVVKGVTRSVRSSAIARDTMRRAVAPQGGSHVDMLLSMPPPCNEMFSG